MKTPMELSAMRQLLVKGRVNETLTDRTLTDFTTRLELIHGGSARDLTIDLTIKPNGYFSLALSGPASDLELPATDAVTLRLTVGLPDGRTRSAETTLTGVDLAPQDKPFAVGGNTHQVPTIPVAPVRLDCSFDPLPLHLSGTVIANNDSGKPVESATVSLGPLNTTTDSRGGFRLGPLPQSTTVALKIDKGQAHSDVTFRPDFTMRTNTGVFSLET